MELFAKAPIQEALLDFQVALPPGSENLDLRLFGQGIEERFPESQKRIELVQHLQFADGKDSPPPARKVSGFLFTSKANGKIVQARRDGFTFNKLRPYSKWSEFKIEAQELWQRYVAFAQPVAIKRIGLRYINRIEIPEQTEDLRRLCMLFPELPAGVPGVWFEYFQRFASQLEDNVVSIVTLSIDPDSPQSKAAIILDIDVIKTIDILPSNDSQIWSFCEEMRDLKNGIFNASLTEEAKQLFR